MLLNKSLILNKPFEKTRHIMKKKHILPTRSFASILIDKVFHCDIVQDKSVKWDTTIDNNLQSPCISRITSPITTPFTQQQHLDVVLEEDNDDKSSSIGGNSETTNSTFSPRLNFAIGTFIVTFLFFMAGITPYWVRDKQGNLSFNKIILVSTSISLLVYAITNIAEECF